MLIIGLTGGIGSGKSTVARFFEKLGVAVYTADDRAKELMVSDMELKAAITALLGEQAYMEDGRLNRAYIAGEVFNKEELLKKLNALVHPAVAKNFQNWARAQAGPYVIKEAAILFENGNYKDADKNILVTAPEEERIARVIARDGVSRASVLSRMKHQWPDAEKIPLADYVIENIDLHQTELQVNSLHEQLISIKK